MRLSELRRAVIEEFGSEYGESVMRDIGITELNSLTVSQAVAAGVPIDEVWRALCSAQGVPPERWHGRGISEPKR